MPQYAFQYQDVKILDNKFIQCMPPPSCLPTTSRRNVAHQSITWTTRDQESFTSTNNTGNQHRSSITSSNSKKNTPSGPKNVSCGKLASYASLVQSQRHLFRIGGSGTFTSYTCIVCVHNFYWVEWISVLHTCVLSLLPIIQFRGKRNTLKQYRKKLQIVGGHLSGRPAISISMCISTQGRSGRPAISRSMCISTQGY